MKSNNIKNILINLSMINGNKKTSEKLLFKSFKKLQKNFYKKNLKHLIKSGVINSAPILFLKTIKRSRKRSMEFPFLLNTHLRLFYGIKSIIKNCSNKKTKPFYLNFETEFINSVKNTSLSVSKKKELYQEASTKKKFANYRWF